MKTVILMRHSYASSDNSAFSDHERPLTSRGTKLAEATADLLVESVRPDRILCSSAVRTRETAEILAAKLSVGQPPESVDSLYLSSAGEYVRVAADVLTDDDNTVLFVGHNPGIASLICSWANDSLSVSPATVAIFKWNVDDWKSLADDSPPAPDFVGLISHGVRVR